MKKDILKKEDIILLVDEFYQRIRKDDLLSPVFTFHVKDYAQHLKLMYDFWENVIFYSGNYAGNPMSAHIKVHSETPLQIQHFVRWNMLFNETVDALFTGKNAELVKQKANSISAIIQLKIIKG